MIEYTAPKRKIVPWIRLVEILKAHEERIAEEKRMLSWELRLEKRIRDAGFKCDAFDGTTTHEQRREYFRGVIKKHQLADVACGQSTFGKAFTTVYREAL